MDFLVFVRIYKLYIIRSFHILSTSSSLNRDQNHSTVFLFLKNKKKPNEKKEYKFFVRMNEVRRKRIKGKKKPK